MERASAVPMFDPLNPTAMCYIEHCISADVPDGEEEYGTYKPMHRITEKLQQHNAMWRQA